MSLSARGVSFAYGGRQTLNSISFSAEHGELISVLGPNGAGKSTLLRCMLGLLKPSSGAVLLDGVSLHTHSAREIARHIAYIPQSHAPTFGFSAFDMVLMGTTGRISAFSQPGKAERDAAEEALETLGIAHFAHRPYLTLSGGERQLVLIARALAQRTRILVLDEPTANLDFGNQLRVLSHIRALADTGYSVLLSTHNPDQAYQFSHRILAMRDGRVLAQGTPTDTLDGALIEALYGIRAEMVSVRADGTRVCVPEIIK